MKEKPSPKAKAARSKAISKALLVSPIDGAFDEIVELIRAARQQAIRAVNTELIELYWRIGAYLHRKIESDGWAKGTVVQLAAYIAQREPGLRGFSPQNLWRMRQFFVAYRDDPKLSPLARVLPWTHNLIVLGQSKRPEEREFYLRMAIQERWSKRELERQFRLAAFERAVLHPPKLSPTMTQDGFEPEYLGKLGFYLEALDRDVRKPHENPAIGLLLCASKDSEVVEYALSRTLSPAVIAEYQTQLPEKKLLAAKLHEFYALNAPEQTRAKPASKSAKRTKIASKKRSKS